MAKLSAFADEVTEDFLAQVEFLVGEKVGHIEPRFINKKNIMDLTKGELDEARTMIRGHGLKVSAIGSPIGRVEFDEPFKPHLDKFKHAVDMALFFETPCVQMFSYDLLEGMIRGDYRGKPEVSMKTSSDGIRQKGAIHGASGRRWTRKPPGKRIKRIHETSRAKDPRYIFVIAHKEVLWRELEKMLKDNFNVIPIVLREQPDRGASTIIEKFEVNANKCCYAFAILTPDDVVENNGKVQLQARPNILFELGWFCRHLGRHRIMMLLQENTNLAAFSDFQGVIYKRFKNHISERFEEIMRELVSAGFE